MLVNFIFLSVFLSAFSLLSAHVQMMFRNLKLSISLRLRAFPLFVLRICSLSKGADWVRIGLFAGNLGRLEGLLGCDWFL